MGEQAYPWTARRRLARLLGLSWCELGFTFQLLVYQISCASSQSRDLASAGMKGAGGLEPPTIEAPREPRPALAARLATLPSRRQAAAGPAGCTVFDWAARVVGTVTDRFG